MKLFFITTLALLFLPVGLLAQNERSEDIERQLCTLYSPVIYFNSAVWENPAIRYDMLDVSLCSAAIGAQFEDKDEAYLAQEGSGGKKLQIYVESFLKLTDKERLFGTASYTNGRTKNILWNETADFSIIYPYVTGDSIGGFMKAEEYSFSGGYARRFGKWKAAANLSYRASISYRDQDPRPRNVVSDLELKLGASHSLNNYTLGVSFSGRKYNQNSNIEFLADKGETPVYHMMGLGVDYVRFAGDQTSTNYSGYGLGGTLELIPENYAGFSLSLGGKYLHITKSLPNLNYAPIAEINETGLSLDGSWIVKGEKLEYGLKLSTEYLKREGTDIILGDPSGNVYPVISQATQYHSPTLQATVSGLIGNHASGDNWLWDVSPYVGYLSLSPRYITTARFIEVSSLNTGVKMQSLWRMKKVLLSVNASFDYTAELSSDYDLYGLYLESSIGKMMLSNISYLSDTHTSLSVGPRIDYYINKKNALFLSGEYVHRNYKVSGVTSLGEINIGFTF